VIVKYNDAAYFRIINAVSVIGNANENTLKLVSWELLMENTFINKKGKPRLIKVLILAALLLVIFALGETALYFAGLSPQSHVEDSIQESIQELEKEYRAPYILHDRSRNGIDNFTDCWMLNLSLFMNTRNAPTSIITNPIYYDNTLEPYEELSLVASGQTSNGNYLNYCMGFRIWLRPLLSIFNYMEIRSMLIFFLWILFGFSIISVFRTTNNTFFTTLYVFCIVSLNPVAISSSLTYMSCFIFAFCGILIVPKITAVEKEFPLFEAIFFLCLGALTQFFDFYTSPIITFAFPMIMLLAAKMSGLKTIRFRELLLILARGLFVWLLAYVGIWLLKLVATALFAGKEIAPIISRVLTEILGDRASRSPGLFVTISACLDNILTPEVIVSLALIFVIWIVRFWKNPDKAHAISQGVVFLIIGILSIIWIAFAPRTYLHRFFQYRTLGVLVMSILAFLAFTSRRKCVFDSHDEPKTMPNCRN
jgi:hypothetical protein